MTDDDTTERLTRRRTLSLSAGTLAVALAGCTDIGLGGGEGGGEQEGGDGEEGGDDDGGGGDNGGGEQEGGEQEGGGGEQEDG